MAYSAGRVGSMQKLRESLKKGGGGNSQYIKQVPANDIMTVRFLTEPEDWYGYYETYDTEIKRYYPLIEGVEKPEGARVSYRYLAVALDVENDQVIPLKLPKDLANRLIMRYDRYETLTDRDYELSRMGEGLDTTYDVTPGDKVARHLDKYTSSTLTQSSLRLPPSSPAAPLRLPKLPPHPVSVRPSPRRLPRRRPRRPSMTTTSSSPVRPPRLLRSLPRTPTTSSTPMTIRRRLLVRPSRSKMMTTTSPRTISRR